MDSSLSPVALIAALGVTAMAAPAPGRAEPAPASAFGRLPAVQSASVSPDGKSVAMVGGGPEQRVLSIADIDNPTPLLISLGPVRTSGVRWAGDGFVLANVTAYGKPEYSKYSYNFTRDLIFTRDGKLKGWLLKSSPETGLLDYAPIAKIIHRDPPLAYLYGADQTGPTLWKEDVASGKTTVATRDLPGGVALDMEGEVRARMTASSSQVLLQVRPKGSLVGWKVAAGEKDRAISLLGYSDPDDTVYWAQEDGDKGLYRLHRMSLADGQTSLVGADKADGDIDVVFDPYTGQALAVVRTTDAPQYEWLDPKLAAAYAAMTRAFKGHTVEVHNWSRDRSRMVLRVTSGDEPTTWYLYDAARREVSMIGDEYPELKGVPLGRKSFITYKAADGLELHAYLHMPPGGRATGLPLVVLPHGGPGARDDAEFDWWAQFLANRGYVVLQPQFRGSDGFGYDLRHAGKQEWAGKMQTDLVDGVRDLAAKGVVDPKRVCIVGASYGGYAALEGMVAHGDTYRCAVAVNAVTDPGSFVVETHRLFVTDTSSMREVFGNNASQLAAASPAQHVDAVKGPILLIHSLQDTTVPPEQTTMMLEHLTKARKTVTSVELPGDDHHLMTSASRVRMLEAIDSFLAKYLPVDGDAAEQHAVAASPAGARS